MLPWRLILETLKKSETILVTGAAGFIGYHVAEVLLEKGIFVVGCDNLNDYYEVSLKEARLARLKKHSGFSFYKLDLSDLDSVKKLFKEHSFDRICHLAAQAGVRYSLENPFTYQRSNLQAFINMLECVREKGVRNFVFASSSSVYGKNKKVPFSESDNVDLPISLYAATKKSNELIAHVYSHLFSIPCTGLRFFTVYGPWGRPDMATFKFTNAITQGRAIDVYNYGDMERDFTYITDIVNGVLSSLAHAFEYEIFNLGNSSTVKLTYFIECIEKELGMTAEKNMLPIQPGDVHRTSADISKASEKLGFTPATSIEEGIGHFITWYKDYYKV